MLWVGGSIRISALCTFGIVLILSNFTKGIFKLGSLFFGMIAGYLLALAFGMVDFSSVTNTTAIVAVPQFMHFQIKFVPSACISLAIVYIVNSVQTIGDLTSTTMGGMDRVPTNRELQGGILTQGVMSIFGAFFGGLPTATYSQNVGIVTVNKVINRIVFLVAAVILMIAGFIPVFSAALTTIPQSVIGGATLSVFAQIAMTGVRMFTKDGLTARKTTVVGMSVALGVGITQVADMDALFHRVHTVFEEDIRKKNLQYYADLDIRHHYVVCDQTKLQEIMLNIISNAIKYTPEGHSIYVEIHEAASENPSKIHYIFSCEDTGIGMSEEYLPHVYEEFSREHTTTENKVQGTGLGLSIIKSMIELMDGSIQVESRQGIGTKFTVDLSFDIASKEEVYGNQNAMKPPAIHTIKGTRILLVEDNELNAEIAKTVLEDVGALITRVEDGQQAVKLFKEKPAGTFDAILMDLMMPVMDGYTATKKIRSLEHSDAKTIPIIAMTANAFQEDAEKCIVVGMNAHLAKPLNIEKMMTTICHLVKKKNE